MKGDIKEITQITKQYIKVLTVIGNFASYYHHVQTGIWEEEEEPTTIFSSDIETKRRDSVHQKYDTVFQR